MKYPLLLVLSLVLIGAGCSPVLKQLESSSEPAETTSVSVESVVVLPLDNNGTIGYEAVYKRFGEYFKDRFSGYHVGDDLEGPAENLSGVDVNPVFVRAVADGTVVYHGWVSGYGGVIVLQHSIDSKDIQTLYGHIALSTSTLKVGDTVAKGQNIAQLGVDKSKDTDGERQHLHFAVYKGTDVKLDGYVKSVEGLAAWINPVDFFLAHQAFTPGAALPDPTSTEWALSQNLWYPSPPRRDIFLWHAKWGELSFSLPSDWDVEYIPSLDALNLYSVSGEGSARERSQILLRYFDASQFLTLSTVEILSNKDLIIGLEAYVARQYEIVKKEGVANFVDQPGWRNEKHIVTDFRAEDGYTKYYVVAANPALESAIYERVLASMHIIK